MRTHITISNFNTALKDTISAHTSQRDNLQDLLEFGLKFYNGDILKNGVKVASGDTVYLTKVLNESIGVKSLSTVKMKNFIKAHANVSWLKTTDNSMVFKKIKKQQVEVTYPTMAWYEFENDKTQAKPDMHPLATLKSWLTKTETGIKDGLVKGDELTKALEAINTVKAILA